jgi:arylsulfatase A-like enzyme
MPAQPPNILLITSDQQRFDTIGPRKPTWLRTPHLDRLCHEGVRFNSAYAQCPVCVPARSHIMTGQDAFTYARGDLTCQQDIPSTTETLPGALRDLGYHTSSPLTMGNTSATIGPGASSPPMTLRRASPSSCACRALGTRNAWA